MRGTESAFPVSEAVPEMAQPLAAYLEVAVFLTGGIMAEAVQ